MHKTPVTVLQELMVKLQEVPTYDCIAQSGPQHKAMFEYRCEAHGVMALGRARSKKEAKHEAAWRALAALAAAGLSVPPPYREPPPTDTAAAAPPAADTAALPLPSSSSAGAGGGAASGAGVGARLESHSSVALLKELCESYGLGAVQYELVGDTGPAHQRQFTMRAALGGCERVATAATKKAARQMAAEQLYAYLREHLASSTKDFVEKRIADLLKEPPKAERSPGRQEADSENRRKRKSVDDVPDLMENKRSCDVATKGDAIVKKNEEALSRALDKAMARYVELREEQPWRPDLGQRIADYHLGVFTHISDEQRKAAEAALDAAAMSDEEVGEALRAAAGALGMSVELGTVPGERGELAVVALGPAAPALALAAASPPAAERAALRYLRRALRQRPAGAARPLASPLAHAS